MIFTKKGFTLAEVLITLTIIGIVASLTIPTLINNIGDQQNKIAWRKAFSDFSQATMLVVADNGGSLAGVFPGDTAGAESLKNAYISKLNAVKSCSGATSHGGNGQGASLGGCWHSGNNSWSYLNGVGIGNISNPGLVLNNGSLVYFTIFKSDCSSPAGDYTRCGEIYVDVNGFKSPNTIGKDVFPASILSDRLVPNPSGCVEGSTAANNYGYGCSAKYLYQ